MGIVKNDIQTPAFLLDLDILERNIKNFHQMAVSGSKKLWPMLKTHKSTEIARMQLNHGATGFLCGTLDECEAMYENFVCDGSRDISIMYAYPVASYPNILRVVKLARDCEYFCLRIDSSRQAELLNQAAAEAGVCINYTVIINSGLNRFGVELHELGLLMGSIASFKHLRFCGISTHPGHAYGEADITGVKKIAQHESEIMKKAASALTGMGIAPQLITSGSTPTYPYIANDAVINCLHPGNYVFMDNMQIALGCCEEEDCALTILTTVVSAPRAGEFIIDAGSKCLGLDKGAHGNGKIQGHGRVKSQSGFTSGDMLVISSLSEEVGKIAATPHYRDKINLKIGDKLEIIPNHSCAAANNTSCYIGMREWRFDRLVDVDMRGNSTTKGVMAKTL